MTTLKKTLSGNSYWNSNGAYQKEYDELSTKLVPASGAGKTVHAELIRGIGRLFYDYCNNGNCNIAEVITESCHSCGGSGYEDETCCSCSGSGTYTYEGDDGEDVTEECEDCCGSGEEQVDCGWCYGDCDVETGVEVSEYYQKFVDLIASEVGEEAIGPVLGVIEGVAYSEHKFEGDEMAAYNNMSDMVIHHVLTSEDSELPAGYEAE